MGANFISGIAKTKTINKHIGALTNAAVRNYGSNPYSGTIATLGNWREVTIPSSVETYEDFESWASKGTTGVGYYAKLSFDPKAVVKLGVEATAANIDEDILSALRSVKKNAKVQGAQSVVAMVHRCHCEKGYATVNGRPISFNTEFEWCAFGKSIDPGKGTNLTTEHKYGVIPVSFASQYNSDSNGYPKSIWTENLSIIECVPQAKAEQFIREWMLTWQNSDKYFVEVRKGGKAWKYTYKKELQSSGMWTSKADEYIWWGWASS